MIDWVKLTRRGYWATFTNRSELGGSMVDSLEIPVLLNWRWLEVNRTLRNIGKPQQSVRNIAGSYC